MKILNQNQAFQNHKNEHYEMIVNFSTLIFHSQTIVIVLGFGPIVINISVNRLQYIVDSLIRLDSIQSQIFRNNLYRTPVSSERSFNLMQFYFDIIHIPIATILD